MSTPGFIRDAVPADSVSIQHIYDHYVQQTAISFEVESPSAEEICDRMLRGLPLLPWLVYEQDHGVVGYAYATLFRQRPAYQQTVETTVYVASDDRGRGIGSQLMSCLLSRLKVAGFHMAIAGVTLPNPKSVALHERLGFEPIGVFPEVGRKFDAWHDVGFWALRLGEWDPK